MSASEDEPGPLSRSERTDVQLLHDGSDSDIVAPMTKFLQDRRQ
jgi:hypothetical protein